MGYRALYRQYRPATFSEVIGQDHITTILKNQVQAGQTAHAYLFAGTRGTGKTSTAKILARAVNCQQPQGGEPCGQCSACQRTQGDHVDIVELDAASNNGVEDIRSILDKVRYTPLELRTKVYIIDEAHALSPNAFNALLKTLEEPPGHVMFILATTEPQRIPATIISRCQRFDFHRLSIGDMTGRMQAVLESAGAVIDPEGLVAIARAAEGGMRDALSLADQCLSFCGDHVTAADVYAVLGSMDGEFLFSMADALLSSDSAKALTLLDQVIREGRDLRVFIHDLAMHMRALLLAKLCGHCSDILDCTEDAMKRYMAQAEKGGEVRLLRASEALLQAESRLKNMALPRVLVESVLVHIARPEEQRTVEDLVERIEALEQRPVAAAQPASVSRESQPVPQAQMEDLPPWETPEEERPLPEPPPISEEAYGAEQPPRSQPAFQNKLSQKPQAKEGPAQIWAQVADLLDQDHKSVAIMARAAKRFSLEGGALEVGFDSPVFCDALSKPSNLALLTQMLQQVQPGTVLKLSKSGDDPLASRGKALFGDAFRME